MSIDKRLQEIKELKDKIASCKDDRVAIDLQTKLMELIKETLEDKEILKNLVKNNK
jgi:hypothetical protein